MSARVTAAGHRARAVAFRALRSVSTRSPARRGRIRGKPVALGLGLTILLLAGALMLPAGTAGPVRGGAGTAEPTSPPPAAAVPSLQADDPAAAVLDLLRLRHECLAEASVLCLDGVDQAGSVAMATDSDLVRQAQAGDTAVDLRPTPSSAEASATELSATVQERTGNAALVVLGDAGGQPAPNTQPASALVIKGEAGWRLRELFDY